MKSEDNAMLKTLGRIALFAASSSLAGMCWAAAPTLGTVSTNVATRTASYYSGTVSVAVTDLGGASSVSVGVTARPRLNRDKKDKTFSLPILTGAKSLSKAGTCAVALSGLIPGRTYDLEIVATGGADESATTTAVMVIPDGYTVMSYKPDGGQSSYPWSTSQKWWYTTPTTKATALTYRPSLGDSVLLWSSKNTTVPLTVTAGTVAEMNALKFNGKYGSTEYCNRQWFLVCGTVTNIGDVTVGYAKSTKLGSAADLVVEDGGEWAMWGNFYLGNAPKAASSLTVESGGRVVLPTNVGVDDLGRCCVGNVACEAGASVVTNRGEMVVQDLFVGGGEGCVDNWGSMTINRRFTIGRNAGSRGVFHHHKGATLTKTYNGKSTYVGYKGEGTLILDDNLTLSSKELVSLGDQDGTAGHLEMNEAAVLTLSGEEALYAGRGQSATGTVEMAGTSKIVSSGGDFFVGCDTGAVGRVTLNDATSIEGFNTLNVGATNNANGLLVLRGGTVNFPSNEKNALLVGLPGDGTTTKGIVRGWGSFFAQRAAGKGVTLFGQVVADGEGEKRDLDLGWFQAVSVKNLYPNLCGTNGWYAVNKGRVRYPHLQPNYNAKYRISGDHSYRETPTLVNSFAFDLTGRTSSHYLHADLYAADRDDIPAGLDQLLTGSVSNRIAGVIRAGYFSTSDSAQASAATKSDFTSGTISWRYDQTGLDADWKVRVYRHDGTAKGSWKRVYSGKFDAATTVLKTDSFACSANDWNLGWFACVATKGARGLFVILR